MANHTNKDYFKSSENKSIESQNIKVLCFAINSINDIYLQQYREKKTRTLTDLNMGYFSHEF